MPVYSDLNSISPTDKPRLEEEESVYQSLYNIFNINPGEAIFSTIGIEIEDELFELMDDVAALEVYRKVQTAVERWESRVKIDNANTVVTPLPDENTFDLLLVFSIHGVDDQKFEFRGSFTK